MVDESKEMNNEYEEEQPSEEIGGDEPLEKAGEPSEEHLEEEEETELARAQREAQENYDKLVRVYAEFENNKKRIEKEKAEFIKYANEGLIKNVLGVMDNLERAVEEAAKHTHSKGLVQGVEMVLKQFKDVLEKYGVREVQAFGEPFDPNVHEAMMHEMEEDFEDNTVIEVFQKGFIFKDRLLRPSMVKVSKKPEKKVDAGMKEEE